MSALPNTVNATAIDRAAEITIKIDRYVELRDLVNEHKTLGKDIKEFLESNKVAEVKSPKGNIARLNPGKPAKKNFVWLVEKLKGYLSPKQFKMCCPPTPDEAMLSAAADEDKELMNCGTFELGKPGNPTMEIIEADAGN